ncbi:MAG: hypothetical protein EA402_12640 [Planctomycetota bacterium]|nr:MAG: hypothetical protein EA402_12640 [Planctomycetota bacterium]
MFTHISLPHLRAAAPWAACMLCLCGSLLLAGVAAGDELKLQDGRQLEGTILSDDNANPVRIRVQQGSMQAVLSIPLEQISEIRRGPSQRQLALQELASAHQDFDRSPFPHHSAWWELIQRWSELGDRIAYREAVRDFLDHFPDHEEARAALGQRRHQGEWMTEAEVKLAQGLVRHQGAWRSSEEIAFLEAEVAAARAEHHRQMDLRRARRAMLRDARRIEQVQGGHIYFGTTHPHDQRPWARCPYGGLRNWRYPELRQPQSQPGPYLQFQFTWNR